MHFAACRATKLHTILLAACGATFYLFVFLGLFLSRMHSLSILDHPCPSLLLSTSSVYCSSSNPQRLMIDFTFRTDLGGSSLCLTSFR